MGPTPKTFIFRPGMSSGRINIMKITNIKISKIKEHEAVDKKHLKIIKKTIIDSGVFKEPIIIDKKTLVVLDGHHRLNSCRDLGFEKIPSIMVDYLANKRIKVISRRNNIFINKKKVIEMGISGKVFPNKTTKHFIPGRIKNLKIPLELLL